VTLRSPWVIIPLSVLLGLFLWFGLVDGADGIRKVGYWLVLVVAIVGPIVAAVRLWREAARSPGFRRRLLAVLAFSTVASVAFAWLAMASMIHIILVLFCGVGVAVATVAAVAASAAFRPDSPGRAGLDRAARSLWTLALAGGILCLSLPLGVRLQSTAVERAKRWVEAAAAEVLAVERSSGHLPGALGGILERVGPPPRFLPPDGGYDGSLPGGAFEFRLDDPSSSPLSWLVYDGRSGAWRRESF